MKLRRRLYKVTYVGNVTRGVHVKGGSLKATKIDKGTPADTDFMRVARPS
jgi:hypothetical protein